MSHYKLKCLYPECGREYDDDDHNVRMRCDGEINGLHGPALLETIYAKKRISLRTDLPGVFQYLDWLPVKPYYVDPKGFELGKPLCYKSAGLAKRLGLKQLYIAFSGFWPERGANLVTRTFKELECQTSMVRYLKNNIAGQPAPYIISSAGNTGNGYNLMSHLLNIPLYLVIPETGLDKLLLPLKTTPFVIVVRGDYTDATDMADQIARRTGLVRDGGVRNVARRAGLGAVMLHAVAHPEEGIKETFDHYFQAVGSGTGAIAAWEAVKLLLADGRFGNTVTRIHMAQNSPFAPISESWEKGLAVLEPMPNNVTKERILSTTADVLTNRHPPYSIAGGLFDTLSASQGLTWKVNNYQVFHAARVFRESEGVDIGPAAAVAVDALRQAVMTGKVKQNEKILLHITGGGKEIQYSRGLVYDVEPKLLVSPDEVERAAEEIGEIAVISNHREQLRTINDVP